MIKLHRCIIKFLASAWITNVATFRLQPTCAEAAFSAVSGTPAPNVATFRLQPTCAEAAFLLCPPTLGAPDVWTFVLSLPCLFCFVLCGILCTSVVLRASSGAEQPSSLCCSNKPFAASTANSVSVGTRHWIEVTVDDSVCRWEGTQRKPES